MTAALNILVSGSSGLIGSALLSLLVSSGYKVTRLVRSPDTRDKHILWNPASGTLDQSLIEGLDAVIHLGGANIAARRWTKHYKDEIQKSRTESAALIAKTIALLQTKPRVFICASAIGFYGDTGDGVVTEVSPSGRGFLASVCREWEETTATAEAAGIRVARLRFGVVLSPRGGALKTMLLPFRLGLGGRIGDGKQWMSWIGLEDCCRAILFVLQNSGIQGAVNLVAPAPVTNQEFTQALASTLNRPAFLPVPSALVKFLLGEMGEELLLASNRVHPATLLSAGFQFHYPELRNCLNHLLGR